MRESLATALNSKNLLAKFNDCPLDKIHALGISAQKSAVGVDAIRFIDAMQVKAYKPLLHGLVKACKSQFKCETSMMVKLCKQAIHEATFTFCQTCSGRKEIKIEEKVITCTSCQGSGHHRHTDEHRASALGLPIGEYQKGWGKRLQLAQGVLSGQYKSALKTAGEVTRP